LESGILKKEPKNPQKSTYPKTFPLKKAAGAEEEEAKASSSSGFPYVTVVNPRSLPTLCPYCGGGHDSSSCSLLANLKPQNQFPIFLGPLPSSTVILGFDLASPSDIDPSVETTLGWRCWIWDELSETLLSPVMGTTWETAEMRADVYDAVKDIRGQRGIHAYRVPKAWRTKESETASEMKSFLHYYGPLVLLDPAYSIKRVSFLYQSMGAAYQPLQPVFIHGIVERFGQYVLGEVGWRSEWAVIRELVAPTEAIGLKLEQKFPEVKVYFPKDEPRSGVDWKWDFK
jgi:hypothetical protein